MGVENEGQLMRACDYLHDVGAVIYFSKNRYPELKQLNEVLITNPQWLAQVFSSLISTKHQFLSKGRLIHRDLLQIWKGYSSSLHPTLLALMQQFEICFPLLPHSPSKNASTSMESEEEALPTFMKGTSIVPSLLPEDEARYLGVVAGI